MTCGNATHNLLWMLSGKKGESCDLVNMLYETDWRYQSYRGIKNQLMQAVTYVYQLASIGMGLHAAQLGVSTNEPASWEDA